MVVSHYILFLCVIDIVVLVGTARTRLTFPYTHSPNTTNGQVIPVEEEVIYLGVKVVKGMDELKKRIAATFGSLGKLRSLWKSTIIPLATKLYFFTTVGHAILLYGCETWVLTQTMTKKLDGAYTRLLRMVRNISYPQKITNVELYGALPKISEVVRQRRIRHLGHALRAPQPVRECLQQPVPGKRKQGQGRTLSLRNLIEEDIPGYKYEELADLAEDRQAWRTLTSLVEPVSFFKTVIGPHQVGRQIELECPLDDGTRRFYKGTIKRDNSCTFHLEWEEGSTVEIRGG